MIKLPLSDVFPFFCCSIMRITWKIWQRIWDCLENTCSKIEELISAIYIRRMCGQHVLRLVLSTALLDEWVSYNEFRYIARTEKINHQHFMWIFSEWKRESLKMCFVVLLFGKRFFLSFGWSDDDQWFDPAGKYVILLLVEQICKNCNFNFFLNFLSSKTGFSRFLKSENENF